MKRYGLILTAVMLLFIANALCEGERWTNKHTEEYLGTVCTMRIYADRDTAEQVWSEVKDVLTEVQDSVSLSVADSDISRFNAMPSGGICPVSSVTVQLMSEAMRLYDLTDGRYDPTVLPLVDLWGFTPRFNTRKYTPVMPYDRERADGLLPLPDAAWIDALHPLVGLKGIVLHTKGDVPYLEKLTPDVTVGGVTYSASIDLGGLAKGYVCDRVRGIMEKYGCTEGYFSCGGSSILILHNAAAEDGCYEMTLKKPREGRTADTAFGSVRAADVCISTSNDISQCHQLDGVVYAHIIDPETGWPVNTSASGTRGGIISVTLLGEDAMTCDALTTGLMLMGADGARQWLAEHTEYQAVIVYEAEDGLHVWDCLDPSWNLIITDPAYQR